MRAMFKNFIKATSIPSNLNDSFDSTIIIFRESIINPFILIKQGKKMFKKFKISLIRNFFSKPSRARISREMKADTRLAIAGVKFIQADERSKCAV